MHDILTWNTAAIFVAGVGIGMMVAGFAFRFHLFPRRLALYLPLLGFLVFSTAAGFHLWNTAAAHQESSWSAQASKKWGDVKKSAEEQVEAAKQTRWWWPW
jgi:hypothetical protein